jgi:hypothetical protein
VLVLAWSDIAVGVTATTANELSPRKNVVASFVPVALNFSMLIAPSDISAELIARFAILFVVIAESASDPVVILLSAILFFYLC